ncbi:ThiF family adenylyltransferase [Methylobacterium sp. A52T]
MSSPRFASARAQALADYLEGAADYPFARLTDSTSEGGLDLVGIVVEPELPQHRAVPIDAEEPVRIAFRADDALPPAVFSARDDFPLNLVHTTQESEAAGRGLCIWEEGWADLRRGLTPQALVERIRDWFARTARGEIHQEGQAVEPLISATADTLVLPPGPLPPKWRIVHTLEHRGGYVVALGDAPAAKTRPYAVFAMTLATQVHGALRSAPSNLEELLAAVEALGGDLLQALGDWLVDPAQLATPSLQILMIVAIPMAKQVGGPVEGWETWAFMALPPLSELGGRLGRTLYEAGALAPRIGRGPIDAAGVELMRWRVVRRLDRASARAHSGRGDAADLSLVAVGAGAIGSNVIVATARAGIGTWTVIDDDVVLPHNTVRQAQGDADVGQFKATSTTRLGQGLLAEPTVEAIVANVLAPGDKDADVAHALAGANVVVDFSASPAVLGALADQGASRVVSMFFGPDGRDLVVLAEGGDRALRIDEIEAQYYLAAATDPALADHLGTARIDFVRYGNACQDLSRPLPPWQVHALCGLASGRLLMLAGDLAPSAGVWRLDPATGAIAAIGVPAEPVSRLEADGIRVTVSYRAMRRMTELRSAALPNETGGVLIGSFDLSRGVAHIVDALPAPPDSRQAPTFFIRGRKDLGPTVDALATGSAGALGYLGEWHAHPPVAAVRPSPDDEEVWQHLDRHIGPTGTPYMMAIVGDGAAFVRIGWRPRGGFESEVRLDGD